MAEFILSILAAVRVFFRSRGNTALEVLALRQQVAVLKRKRPRPRLNRLDRLFWTTLRRVWSSWAEGLVIVRPETVVAWHRAGFAGDWVGHPRQNVLARQAPMRRTRQPLAVTWRSTAPRIRF